PLAAAGLDVREICRGAREMRDFILGGAGEPAVSSALFLAHHSKRGYNIHDTFLFDPKLEKLGGWYRQLLGESIGKRENRKGEDVRTGITPTVSIGSRDLHSVGQLALDGPKDKMTTFVVGGAKKGDPLRVPQSGLFSASVPEVGGKS